MGFQNTACQGISCISKTQTEIELWVKTLRGVKGNAKQSVPQFKCVLEERFPPAPSLL